MVHQHFFFTNYILEEKNHFQNESADLILKIEVLQFFRSQKELEIIDIKNLFDYKLSIGKCLLVPNVTPEISPLWAP